MKRPAEIQLNASWQPLALETINKTLGHDLIKLFPEINGIIGQTRDLLQQAGIQASPSSINDLLKPLEQAAKKLTEQLKTCTDQETEKAGLNLQKIITTTRERIRFLKDFFDFQVESNQNRRFYKQKFALAQRQEFTKKYPQYGDTEAKIKRSVTMAFDTNWRGLAAKMGFPLIADDRNLQEVRTKLTHEVWSIYNRKNGLPADNRKYQPGTKLPLFRENCYHIRYFASQYGGFDQAVEKIILQATAPTPATLPENNEILPEKTITALLELSMQLGRLPAKEDALKTIELPHGKTWEDVTKDVQSALQDEMVKTIKQFGQFLPYHLDPTDRYAYLRWEFFLLETKYFQKYGVKVYDLWLGKEKLECLTHHRFNVMEKRLKEAFLGPTNLRHMRQIPRLFRLTKETLAQIETMDNVSLRKFVEEEILEHPFPPAINSDADYMAKNIRAVLHFFANEGITISPTQSHFVLFREKNTQKSMDRLAEKAALFRRMPEIPVYMRQILYAQTQTPTEIIGRRIAIYQEKQAPLELYVHFLNQDAWKQVEAKANELNRLKKTYDWAKQQVRLLEEKSSAQKNHSQVLIPSIQTAPETTKDKPKTDRRALREKKNHLALEELQKMGYPYDKMSQTVRYKLSPCGVLKNIKLMLKLFGKIHINYLGRSKKFLREEAARRNAEAETSRQNMDQLNLFVAERGLTPPPKYLLDNRSPQNLLDVIAEIEKRGVPFLSKYWWWINASVLQRDAQIELAWERLSRQSRHQELASIYGYDATVTPSKITDKEPDHLRRYCKIIAAAGHKVSQYWTYIHQYSPAGFRKFFYDRLAGSASSNTPEESNWILRYELAKAIETMQKAQAIKSFRDISVEELLDYAAPFQLEGLKKIIDNRPADTGHQSADLQKINRIISSLRHRSRTARKLENKLRRARMGYADMDYFTTSDSRMAFVIQRISDLETIRAKITHDHLAQNVCDIPVLAELCDESNLTPKQKTTRIYLNNLGVSPLRSEKLARSVTNHSDLKAKVRHFSNIRLDLENYGKDRPDIEDYEEYLEQPLTDCKQRFAPEMRRKIANRFAQQKLMSALGIEWDQKQGWTQNRTTRHTMWKKFRFLSQNDLLHKSVLNNPELITRYSFFSIRHLQKYVDELQKVLAENKKSEHEKKLFTLIGLEILHAIACMLNNGFFSKKILEKAQQIMLSGKFQEIVKKFKPKQNRDLNEIIERVSSKQALEIYKKIVESYSVQETRSGAKKANQKQKLLTAEEELELARRKDAGDKEARKILVERNLALVIYIAKRYSWSHLPMEDLIQEGNTGLIEGVERFDPNVGARLSSYATWWIRQHIQRYIQTHGKNIRTPEHIQAQLRQYNKYISNYIKEKGQQPSDQEIMANLEISPEKLENLKEYSTLFSGTEISLDKNLNNDEGNPHTLHDTIKSPDHTRNMLMDARDRLQFLENFKKIFFNEYHRTKNKKLAWDIFINRFGFNDESEFYNLEDIGQKHHVTRERIRQIETFILDFIKSRPAIIEELQDLLMES